MDGRQLNAYKKEKRRQNRSKVREALFVRDYIFHKHFNIYEETAQMYNELNTLYPNKPDLRRTDEFKQWVSNITKQTPKSRKYIQRNFLNIPVSNGGESNVNFVQTHQPESPQPASRPNIVEKTMELRIPLLNIENKTPENISTQTLQTLTEEVIEEGTTDTIEPSLYEEISPEVIDCIIADLRGDPGLKDIMTNLEEEIEQEQVGMEVDVEIDDRLETELENLLW